MRSDWPNIEPVGLDSWSLQMGFNDAQVAPLCDAYT